MSPSLAEKCPSGSCSGLLSTRCSRRRSMAILLLGPVLGKPPDLAPARVGRFPCVYPRSPGAAHVYPARRDKLFVAGIVRFDICRAGQRGGGAAREPRQRPGGDLAP